MNESNYTIFDRLLEDFKIREMPPPSHAGDDVIRVTCGIYLLLFIAGLWGNSSVLTVLFCTRETRKNNRTDNGFIFISALCVVDSLVVLSMPMTIVHILLGHWMFGSGLCKVYWQTESFGKILSTFILTLMSLDRYLAVCWPAKPELRTRKVCIATLCLAVIVALLLLSPLPYNAQEQVFRTKVSFYGGAPTRFVIATCNTKSLGEQPFRIFIMYIFVTGYCIPGCCMLVFYSLMLLRIRTQVSEFGQSQIPLRRITLYTLGVVSFYFFCWTPYWLGIISYLFYEGHQENRFFVYVMYAIHALPFVNSALNWIFYALLNTQLRRSCQDFHGTRATTAISAKYGSCMSPSPNISPSTSAKGTLISSVVSRNKSLKTCRQLSGNGSMSNLESEV